MQKYLKGAVALLATLIVHPCFAYWQITYSGGTSLDVNGAPQGPTAQWSVKSTGIYSAWNYVVYGPVSATINWVGSNPPASVTCIETATASQELYNPPIGSTGSDIDSTMYWWIGDGFGDHCINTGPASPYTWACQSSGTRTTVHTTYPFTVSTSLYAVKQSLFSPYPMNPRGIYRSGCTYSVTLQ